ncbi:hypothetical protein D9613_006230 [Agrocybe pediades]|uniref:F-box domain-containing protein n=1 Tax=Agrocybe pediades TaxID=84607 RepID=A0A8H4QV28_9AGAR|nr:hypothetical protein D9613_006230 [Agrocybe pediades]
MKLTELPPELIEEILVFCDPVDVAQAAQTCTALRAIVYFAEDSKLWRELYLAQPFDDPRKCISQDGRPRTEPVPWKNDLQRIIRARTVVNAEDSAKVLREGELETVLETFLMLICNVPPWTPSGDLSMNLGWSTVMLERKFLDWVEGLDKRTFAEKQLASRIHSYYGLTRHDLALESRAESRSYVYSLEQYKPETEYGPFLEGETVDWEHIRMIHHVMSMHLVELEDDDENFRFAIFPMSMPFIQPVLSPDVNLNEENDWAAVAGPWSVTFCFIDHRDLLRYNETGDTSIFEDPAFREEFRSLQAKLIVTHTEHDPEHPDRPKIYFFGEMEEPSNSTMSGHVKMTKDNQIRWHFVSGDQVTGVWRLVSEGIQVGGIRSSYGVLGTWSTVFHDDDDPVGPFWLRKQHDKSPTLPVT